MILRSMAAAAAIKHAPSRAMMQPFHEKSIFRENDPLLLRTSTMAWDKFKIAQKFFQKANAIRPEDEADIARREELLALQDVYYDCYMSSFSREELIKRLQEVAAGKVEMPEEEEVDENRYRDTYIKEAQVILSNLLHLPGYLSPDDIDMR